MDEVEVEQGCYVTDMLYSLANKPILCRKDGVIIVAIREDSEV